MFSEKDSFYAWTFERRRPLWQTVLSFLVPVVTLACCLFPVFPHWCKLGVLYFCLAFLTLIFGVLICKYFHAFSQLIEVHSNVWSVGFLMLLLPAYYTSCGAEYDVE